MKTQMVGARFLCTPECDDDAYVLSTLCLQSKRMTNGNYAVPDLLVNRVALQLPYVLPQPPRKGEIILPTGASLLDYQVGDMEKLRRLRSPLNANRPGYGKTIEALLYAQAVGAERILVLVPKLVKVQWAAQSAKWGPRVPIEISPRRVAYDKKRLVIDNYHQLYSDAVFQMYKGVPWDLLIVDEIHRIKNGGRKSAEITERIKGLPGVCRNGLSGSPIFDRPSDLWSICDFLNPWYFGNSFRSFQDRFCHLETNYWGSKFTGLTKNERARKLLTDTLDLFMIRNPDNLVGRGMQEQDILLEMGKEQRKAYRSIARLAMDDLEKMGITVANAMAQSIRLQQMTSNPGKFGIKENPKFDWVQDFVENSGQKLAVFSCFRETVEALNQRLGSNFATIHGGIDDDERERQKRKFIEDPTCMWITGTIGAMGESVDGLQEVCHDLATLDRDWSPEANDQAYRRLYRGGQESFVNVYNLIMEHSIDEKVGRVVLEKAQDIKAVFGDA